MIKKTLGKLLIAILGVGIILSPFVGVWIYGKNQQKIYTKTFYAALVDKINYLEKNKDEKKIILIGGSNVAFGFNSNYLEKEFSDYKIINFGLYAMLGTKIMMDLAKDYIHKDDKVFVIPEINSQSTSTYFDPNSALKATEERPEILQELPWENYISTIGATFAFIKERASYSEPITPTGVYQRKNFNNYGDILYEEKDEKGRNYRAHNRMKLHYDPTMLVSYKDTIDSSFYNYLNNYNDYVEGKNAKLYYCFSPVNSKANISTEEEISNYYWRLRNNLDFKVIGNPKEYIIDPHYFYDSNFHLNDAGAIYRTYYFVQDINRDVFGISAKPSFDIPNMPDYVEEQDPGEDSPTASYFEYQEYENGYLISGVVDSHTEDTSLTLPKVYNHKFVYGIDEYAFEECTKIKTLLIPKSISILKDGCFGNCSSLEGVYIETYDPSDIMVSFTGDMTKGTNANFKIYIHSESFNLFVTNYYWGAYTKYFVRY